VLARLHNSLVSHGLTALGLQCHTAPFSWKLVFECDHQLYEIIMTACSPKEETEWRIRLMHPEASDPLETSESALYSSISLNIKSLGTVFGKPGKTISADSVELNPGSRNRLGTVARRVSIHRATTVGPRSQLCQVILKNTSTMKDRTQDGSRSPINRSQSLLVTNARMPVLAPSRSERARLEALLADVWSRKILPFPGISSRARSEHLVRSSASTMIRKFSVASITGSLARRSTSNMNMIKAYNEELLPQINVDALDPYRDITTTKSDRDEKVEGQKQPLAVIQDEPERGSSSHSSLVAGDYFTLSGTIRKMDPSKLDPEWRPDDEEYGTPTLRTTSANSTQQNRTPPSTTSVESISPCAAEKENLSRRPEIYQGPTRSTSKWSKVSYINRGLVVSGLRNFFR
jgi:hypothetical protein